MKKLLYSLGIFLVFVIVFAAINTLHSQYFPVRVVLYDALLDAAIALAITAIFVLAYKRFNELLSKLEISQMLAISFLVGVLYSLTFPTIIDRSLSVYILEKIAQRGGAIRQDALDEIIKKEFFPEHQLIKIRLTEAINSGTVTVENNCIRLTQRGQRIASFTRFFRSNVLPKKREVMGQFSDDLTDPFRNSKILVPFECDSSAESN